ncbi:MAG TPA: hypothetical protein VJP60_01635 [Rhizomicrobium sp.]|nr:hypothetical protein [Rhizomicrobium sp.]
MSDFWKDGPTGNMAATPAPAPAAAAPASPFWQDGPKPAAAPQAGDFWKTSPAIGQGGTPEQAQAFAAEMVRTGAMTKDAADTALRAGGNEPAPVDSRSDEAKAFDATFAPPAAPEGYKLDFMGRLPPGTSTPTVALFNGAATAWLHEIQMPAGVGTALVERAMEVGQRAQQMSPPQLELWKREQAAAFDRVAKSPARAAELRRYADKVLAMQTKSPEFSAGLLKSGARFDATVLMNLALHGERLAAREKLK